METIGLTGNEDTVTLLRTVKAMLAERKIRIDKLALDAHLVVELLDAKNEAISTPLGDGPLARIAPRTICGIPFDVMLT